MAIQNKKILMLAAENGALPGGKVGGMGDVVRDIPLALCELGHRVDVLMPGYQHFSRLPGAKKVAKITVEFRAEVVVLELYKLPKKRGFPGLQNWIIDHPMLAPMGAGKIYCDDASERPFATDASKFALFSIAAAQAIVDGSFGKLDAIHLHDWHTALVAVLAHYHPSYSKLTKTPMVYTIHNLSLQGVRPFSWDDSALENWFREMPFDYQKIRDPQYDNCYNPMRAAINLCDKVHAVSPNYVTEIQRASNPKRGFVGGEGLEDDLRAAAKQKRLVGILNGCEYPEQAPAVASRVQFIGAIKRQLTKWSKAETKLEQHRLARSAITAWQKNDRKLSGLDKARVLTSVGRISDQKVRILLTKLTDKRTALEHLLSNLRPQDVLILLGSGDPRYEAALRKISDKDPKFIFLRGYSDQLAQLLYTCGDLFLMPSSFEPCGISQMLAMRSHQPCLAHNVGGLADTIKDDVNGFVFAGDSPLEQAQNMLIRTNQALNMQQQHPEQWQQIKRAAGEARFAWSDVAKQYIDELY